MKDLVGICSAGWHFGVVGMVVLALTMVCTHGSAAADKLFMV